jgi:hypothetical protein
MARQSTKARVAVIAAVPSPCLPPPSDLSEEEAGYWREITESLPADRFGGDNACLLVELVRSIARSRRLAGELHTMRDWKLAAGDEIRLCWRSSL